MLSMVAAKRSRGAGSIGHYWNRLRQDSVRLNINGCININSVAMEFTISATSKHTATVIFLHGLGDDGEDWSEIFKKSVRWPHIRYVFPSASEMPVTVNDGERMPSWFDVYGLTRASKQDEKGIKSAAQQLQLRIAEEVKLGIARDRIVLGGVSQGGALVLYSSFAIDQEPLAGIVAMSTWVPLPDSFPAAVRANQTTPVLQCHGDDDYTVSYSYGQMTSELLKSFNNAVTFKTYPGMGHIPPTIEELEDIKQFIHKCLSPI